MDKFRLHSDFEPTGDQPQAIKHLTNGVEAGMEHQVLLGVTGSGKTFSVANVIKEIQKPTLVISHNKTLAAQLYQEYKEFFPDNAVEYFVSYYDYYQPEAYIPQTDTYIEKDAAINEDIDKLRLSTTTSLLTRQDVIVVASVSCIYNLGSPKEYREAQLRLKKGMPLRQTDLLRRLTQLFYKRSDYDFRRGTFRVKGDTVDLYPAYQEFAVRLEILEDKLQKIKFLDPVSGKIIRSSEVAEKEKNNLALSEKQRINKATLEKEFTLYPAKHYLTDADKRENALQEIRQDLVAQVKKLKERGKELEAHRLKQKTEYDLEIIEEVGYCKGIENYSRYFDGRQPGEPPDTLLDFFSDDYLTIIDESHITVPQIRGMYNGDQARKQTLIEHGFRLPSAKDNRPLQFNEFLQKSNQIIYTSATLNDWEVNRSVKALIRAGPLSSPPERENPKIADYPKRGIVEQLIRPTGIVDPEIQLRGTQEQIENLISEIQKRVTNKQRVLVTTLTKRMAEDLSEYLREQDIRVHYLHADIDTLDRSDILDDLRKGKYDVVVGINLLREGLDLPEVSLVAILDADKEGFLRSETSLIQTMGRAARHTEGMVIMYADKVTGSMQRAIDEVKRRRKIQLEYNEKHNIKPQPIKKPIRKRLIKKQNVDNIDTKIQEQTGSTNQKELLTKLQSEMQTAAENLEFEKAAILRDRIDELKRSQLKPS